MTIYEQNLIFLKQAFPELLNYLLNSPGGRCRTETAKNGSLTLTYTVNNTPYYLHSKFNPQKESAKIIASQNTSADHIVVMGLGLGYHLQEIMAAKAPYSRILLVEPDGEIARASLHTLRWFELLNRPDFFYVLGVDFNQIAHAVYPFINMASFEKIEYIELPAETRILGDFFGKARETLEKEINVYAYDFKTRLAESFVSPRNLLANLPYILETRAAAELEKGFKGIPGFVVAAGPSLDKNILHLKKIRNRGVIIAVDTALKPLLKKGIQPHFVAVGDPSHKNYRHLQGAAEALQYFVAAEAGIANRVFRDFDDKVFTLSVGKPLVRMLEEHCGAFGEIEGWGSVISIALDLGVYMGLDPLILVGQDFAFTDSRNHCRGTAWEEEKLEMAVTLDKRQRMEKEAIAGNRKVMETTDIYGEKIFTSERLELYKNYMARLASMRPGVRFINATEGGILGEIPQMRLYDAIKRFVFGKETMDLASIHHLPTLKKRRAPADLIAFLESRLHFFKDYLGELQAFVPCMDVEIGEAGALAIPLGLQLLERAEEVKNTLYKDPQNGELAEIWSFSPIYRFIREYGRIRDEYGEVTVEYVRAFVALYVTYFKNLLPVVTDVVESLERVVKELSL